MSTRYQLLYFDVAVCAEKPKPMDNYKFIQKLSVSNL